MRLKIEKSRGGEGYVEAERNGRTWRATVDRLFREIEENEAVRKKLAAHFGGLPDDDPLQAIDKLIEGENERLTHMLEQATLINNLIGLRAIDRKDLTRKDEEIKELWERVMGLEFQLARREMDIRDAMDALGEVS